MKAFKIVEHRHNQVSSNYYNDEGDYITHQYTPVTVSLEEADYELGQNEYEIDSSILSHRECYKLLGFGKFEYEDDVKNF